MTDLPREKLCELIATYGQTLCDDPRRCEALLRDVCGAHRREIHVLVSALRERVAADLLAASEGVPREVRWARLTQRLQDNLGLTEEIAQWAVDSWALALGKLSRAELDVVPASSSTASGPAPPVPSRRRRLIFAGLGVVGFLVVLIAAVLSRGDPKSTSTQPSGQLDQGTTPSDSLRQEPGQEPVELGEYVKFFMLGGSRPEPSWDLVAEANALPLKWLTNGVEENVKAYSDPDQFWLIRKGEARIKVNGEVFWTLKQGEKEELRWEIMMPGDRRFGPAKVAIMPKSGCLGPANSGCYFDIEKMFITSKIHFGKLCEDHHTDALFKLYEVQVKGKKSAYVVYKEVQVGRKLSYLTFYWIAPGQTEDAMCGWLREEAERLVNEIAKRKREIASEPK